ncbi:MAG: hypothetical protein WBF07_17725, partial [Xanthobacteraceae bacterium]
IPGNILTRNFSYGAALGLSIMNLEALGIEAKLHDVPVPLAEAIMASLRTAAAEEGGTADVTRIIRPMERAAGVTVGSASTDDNAPNANAAAVTKSYLPSLPRAVQRG